MTLEELKQLATKLEHFPWRIYRCEFEHPDAPAEAWPFLRAASPTTILKLLETIRVEGKSIGIFLEHWDRNDQGKNKFPITHEFIEALGALRYALMRVGEIERSL